MARTGRPPILGEVIGTRLVKVEPGTPNERVESVPVTRLEQIVNDIKVGLPTYRAAARAGVHRDTLKDWEHTAADARKALAQGTLDDDVLTEKQRLALDFSGALHQAEIEWELQQNMLLQGLAQGMEIEHVTVKVEPNGKTTTTTRRERTLPDAKVIQWRLARRLPDDYTDRVVVEGTGDGGAIPVEVRASNIAAALAALAAKQADEADETS